MSALSLVTVPFTEIDFAAIKQFLSSMIRYFMCELESVQEKVRSTHGQVVELKSIHHTLNAQFVANVSHDETLIRQMPLRSLPSFTELDNPCTRIENIETISTSCSLDASMSYARTYLATHIKNT